MFRGSTPDSAAWVFDTLSGAGIHIAGRRLFETFVAATYTQARVASGDLGPEIQRLKQEAGDYILAQGGVQFARSLAQSGLVDEYRFMVLSVALGSGEELFTQVPDELDLELVSWTAFRGGVLGNVYRPARHHDGSDLP